MASAQGVVAHGRTVLVDRKAVAAGEVVKLPAEEIAHLRERGFLVDPDKAEIPKGDGPSFGVQSGPTVKGMA